MKSLFIFLLIALISICAVKPTDKSKIWISAVLIPLVCLIIYGVIACISKSAYNAGKEVGMAVIPAVISGIIIHFQLKRKFKNDNVVKFPVVLVVFIGLSLIGTIAQYALGKKGEKSTQESTLSETQTQQEKLSYNGLSFSYPDGWEVETEVIQEDLSFQVNCERKGNSSDIFSVVWLRGTHFGTTAEMVENTIKGINGEISVYKAEVNAGERYKGTFKGCITDCTDYNFSLLGVKTYGRLISFIMNDNTIIITKQSDTKEKLDTVFQVIEDSFDLQ